MDRVREDNGVHYLGASDLPLGGQSEEQEEFAQIDLAVLVLVDFLDNVLQGDMGLGLAQLLHHPLQFIEIDKSIVIFVVSKIKMS